jgi:hypothetical protein
MHYPLLQDMIAQLKQCSEAGDWEGAAQIATQISARVLAKNFPVATQKDRAAIETCLAEIAAITERAVPLHEDIGRLLRAFRPAEESPAAGSLPAESP